MRFNLFDLRPHIFFQIAEGVEAFRFCWACACLCLQLFAQSLVLKTQHAAIGVVDNDERPRTQQVMRNDERTESVFRRDPTGVADNVRLARFEPANCST